MDDNKVFDDSYRRIFGTGTSIGHCGEDFFEYFYRQFVDSSPEVALAFRNTDMNRQKSMLKKSLMYAVNFSCCQESLSYMEPIAKRHSISEQNVPPELYQLWMDAMVAAVKQFDTSYCDQVELAWRLALDHAITYMKYMHSR